MISRLFHALIAAGVVAGAAAAASYGVTHWVPEGKAHDRMERWLTAGGQALCARLPKNWKKKLSAGRERLQKAGVDPQKFEDAVLGEMPQASAQTRRLFHLYNIGAWALAGFILCLVLTILFAISSIKSALALGFKVTLTLLFLQGALILTGVVL